LLEESTLQAVPAAPPAPEIFDGFLVVLIFIVFGIGFAAANIHVISKLLRKDAPNHVKNLAYECGEPSYGSSFIRFDIRFYAIALVFLIFDVEVIFLVPWAVALKKFAANGAGALAFFEAAAFVAILTVGLVYVWRKGDIEWIPRGLQQAREAEAERVKNRAEAAAATAAGSEG
jgi:NADH-quinone oxidoreductase subunit A